MQVKCVKTTGYQFGHTGAKRGLVDKITYQGLTLGKNYQVYGMIIFAEELHYLIYDDFEMPSWYFADLFQIEETDIPSNWHHRFLGLDEDGLSAIWGYDELVNSPKHYNGLAEKETDDIVLFLRRKREMEEEYSS